MRWAAFIVLAACLVVGVVAAAGAYSPPLALGEALVGLTLNAPAGAVAGVGPRPHPIAKKGATLDQPLIAELRAAGVRYVRVKEFAFARWPARWAFVGAVAGVTAAGVVLRRTARRGLATAATRAGAPSADPLDGVRSGIEAVAAALALPDRALAAARALEHLTALIHGPLATFLDERRTLEARRGPAGYAAIMSSFALLERQVHRAWSALVDGYEEEARACIAVATDCFELTRSLTAARPAGQ